MNRDQKAAVIDEVAGQITESEAIFAVDYRGISVPQAAELRARLRDADATFRVVKNTLTERAADKAGAEALKAYLEGPTAHDLRPRRRRGGGQGAERLPSRQRPAGVQGRLDERRHADGRADRGDRPPALPRRPLRAARRHGRLAADRPRDARSTRSIGGLARQLQQIAEQGLVGGDAPAPEAVAEAPADDAPAEPAAEAAPADDAPAAEAPAETAAEASAPRAPSRRGGPAAAGSGRDRHRGGPRLRARRRRRPRPD